MSTYDAVVIGAGPNGLVAANVLVDQGWSVVVLEATGSVGGGVRTEQVTAPGFRNDLFSAFYPFTAASPVIADLGLDAYGLRWAHAPFALVHPLRDGPAAVLSRNIDETAASLRAGARGDDVRYRRLYSDWEKISGPLIDALLRPFPPVRHGMRLARRAGVSGTRDLIRRALVPLRRFVNEEFDGVPAHLLFAGCALHADLTPETAGSALFGWLLVCLGQQVGFPVPLGGARGITDALLLRLESRGGTVLCDTPVTRIEVRKGRAVGVGTPNGVTIGANRAIVATCDATTLFTRLVDESTLSSSFLERVSRIERASGTFKLDWALSRPIPWTSVEARQAGTVHVAESLDELSWTSTELATGLVPSKPFLLVGQMTTADPTRSPPGTESAWAYTHVPQTITGDAGCDGITGSWDDWHRSAFVARAEARIEALAPGFQDRIIARHVMAPPDLQATDPNLIGGDISGGSAQLHQQAVFRPVAGWGRPETPVQRLFLGSASAHPGGAVHGACGANAARAAIWHHRLCR